MRKLKHYTPAKPLANPFGEGTGEAHTFHLGRSGVLSITEQANGSIEIIAERHKDGPRIGLIMTVGGGYARLDDSEVEQPPPAKKEKPAS